MKCCAWGSLPDGTSISAYTLSNAAGSSLQVLTYGGIVTSLRVPDRHGRIGDVVLGFDCLAPYVAGHPYFGAITGRIAGRVSGGRIDVAGRTYELPLNSGRNHIHGGHLGLDKRVWTAQPVTRSDGSDSLRLNYRSPDGEEGYPGMVHIAVTYTLSASNEFIVETEATSDQATPLCLAHHSYFNLAGEESGPVTDHIVHIPAAASVHMEDDLTLLGVREPVAGRGTDFTTACRLGDALPHLFKAHGGLYPLREQGAGQPPAPSLAARIVEPNSGRVLEVSTDEDCLQFYTGSAIPVLTGKSGHTYGPHSGLCLECQGYPDATTKPGFGDILVRPGRPQRHTTIYTFSAV